MLRKIPKSEIRFIMRITKYRLTAKCAYIKATLITLFCCFFLTKGYVTFESTGDNLFHVFVNGTEVGTVADMADAEKMYLDARKSIAQKSNDLVFMDVELSYTGEELLWGEVDRKSDVQKNIMAVLEDSVVETMQLSYTVKVNEYMVSLSNKQEVHDLLQAAISNFDEENRFDIELVQDYEREFNVFNAQVVDTRLNQPDQGDSSEIFPIAGIKNTIGEMFAQDNDQEEMDFDDYQLGVKSMGFSEEIEIVEAYLPDGQLKTLEQAINELTKEQEMQQIYEVVSGDTLSEIAIKLNIPMQTIVDMNESLDSVNATLHIGQELIITIPEPELSVTREEINYYEETYNAPIQYIDVDTWYTTQTEVIQQPSAGFRKIVAQDTYVNDERVSQDILKEELVMEAVPKIVKRGTKIPPTYIKPISGGRKSSSFGKRTAPTKGASTYHKGVDWATPTGTPVVASCGGTVAKAGWGSGYGYVVYINHEDGRQTRYAHLSKVQVKVGQKVKQGQQIALSGNTGVSSGPHVHFEMLIGGSQVNPEKYLK